MRLVLNGNQDRCMNKDKISTSFKPVFGRVLIVDTDSLACELLQLRLESDGFKSEIMADGRRVLDIDLSKYDIILVDLMGCEFNGLKLTRAIKQNPKSVHIPVIICTSKKTEEDILNGFDAGADDYVVKPFSTRELLARIRAVIRRCVRTYGSRKVHEIVRFKDLTLDVDAGVIAIGEEVVSLTNIEYILLRLLMRNRNSYFSSAEIRQEAWCGDQSVTDRAIATAFSRLRGKIGEFYGRHIVCRPGIGYGFIE